MTLSPEELQRQIEALQAQLAATQQQQAQTQGEVQVTDTATLYGPAVGINLGTIIYGRDPREDERRQLVWYLHTLAARLNILPLQGLASKLDQRGAGVAMSSVYTMLATTRTVEYAWGEREALGDYLDDQGANGLTQVHHPDYALPADAIVRRKLTVFDTKSGVKQGNVRDFTLFPMKDSANEDQGAIAPGAVTLYRSLLATEAVRDNPRLVLLGDPGSGKSTFLRHMTWLLARRELGELGGEENIPDGLKPRLPILLPLQKLARRLAVEGTEPATVFAALLAEMERYDVEQGGNLLREALHNGAALLLFDGLDEIPVEGEPGVRADRMTTLHAVRTFASSYPDAPSVLTCRTRAFSDDLRECLGWSVEELAPFTMGQVRHFVPAWYAELAAKGHLEQERADRLQTTLIEAIVERPRLREMAETPLLLTLMALVLYNEGTLPKDRPQLYEKVLDLLLGRWDKVREGQTIGEVIGRPGWTSAYIMSVLDRLSYEGRTYGSCHQRQHDSVNIGCLCLCSDAFRRSFAFPERIIE